MNDFFLFRLLFKVIIKIINGLCRIFTMAINAFPTDPTQILVKNRTECQNKCLKTERQSIQSSRMMASQVLPRLWVIIPFRDRWQLTETCLETLFRQEHNHFNLGVILIDNGSREHETQIVIKKYETLANIKGLSFHIYHDEHPFNFSTLNNTAVKKFTGEDDWLFFLNNDIEFLSANSLYSLLEFAMSKQDDLGALGCTLLYPSKRIQHLFAAPGVKIVAAHPGKGWHYNPQHLWFQTPQPVAAVTGAAFLCHGVAFNKVGGFEPKLASLGQDIDLCLKFQKQNLCNWVLPNVIMIHHESASKKDMFNYTEVAYIYNKWGNYLCFNPYYSDKFSRWAENPIYSVGKFAYPWRILLDRKRTNTDNTPTL